MSRKSHIQITHQISYFKEDVQKEPQSNHTPAQNCEFCQLISEHNIHNDNTTIRPSAKWILIPESQFGQILTHIQITHQISYFKEDVQKEPHSNHTPNKLLQRDVQKEPHSNHTPNKLLQGRCPERATFKSHQISYFKEDVQKEPHSNHTPTKLLQGRCPERATFKSHQISYTRTSRKMSRKSHIQITHQISYTRTSRKMSRKSHIQITHQISYFKEDVQKESQSNHTPAQNCEFCQLISEHNIHNDNTTIRPSAKWILIPESQFGQILTHIQITHQISYFKEDVQKEPHSNHTPNKLLQREVQKEPHSNHTPNKLLQGRCPERATFKSHQISYFKEDVQKEPHSNHTPTKLLQGRCPERATFKSHQISYTRTSRKLSRKSHIQITPQISYTRTSRKMSRKSHIQITPNKLLQGRCPERATFKSHTK